MKISFFLLVQKYIHFIENGRFFYALFAKARRKAPAFEKADVLVSKIVLQKIFQ